MHPRLIATLVGAALLLAGTGSALAHCEIPCGIYGDKQRIMLIAEHITTIEKSMKQIQALTGFKKTNYNQLVRWIGNKEAHAEKLQEIVWQYFMTQRIKPAPENDAAAKQKNVERLTTLHLMLVKAMKAKQTTNFEHVEALRSLLRTFAESYFDADGLKHLSDHHQVFK